MMERNVLQTPIKGALLEDFNRYKSKFPDLKDAEVSRELLSFALRIKLNDKEDDRPSTRELVEEIYTVLRRTNSVLNLTHTQTFNEENFNKQRTRSGEVREQLNASVNSGTEDFLKGKKKG